VLTALVLGGLLASASTRASAAESAKAERSLEIYWIDSEGGGSTLIVTPAGESVLIDSGNPGGRDSGRIVAAAKAAGLTRIDHLIVTHLHVDHVGWNTRLENGRWVPSFPKAAEAFNPMYLNALAAAGARVLAIEAEKTILVDGDRLFGFAGERGITIASFPNGAFCDSSRIARAA
jgi:glyoxylase-like metal-dependent hydrolase (beta-lactamase superfamily II)